MSAPVEVVPPPGRHVDRRPLTSAPGRHRSTRHDAVAAGVTSHRAMSGLQQVITPCRRWRDSRSESLAFSRPRMQERAV